MSFPAKNLRIGIAVAVVLLTIGWLALSGYNSSKSYYVTLPELAAMGEKAYSNHLRLEGFVAPGTIVRSGARVTFTLNEFESHTPKAPGRSLRVEYSGTEPPPDTFKDDAQALADGTYGRDGLFHATALQAKCASKYAPAQPGTQQPGTQQPGPASAQQQ